MCDDDLIRRGDALNSCRASQHRYEAYDAIDALPAVTVRVKLLVWREVNDGNHKKGECFCTRSPVSFAPIAAHKKHDGWWLNIDCKTYPSLDAAKAAAQADYEARIRTTLAELKGTKQ